MLRVAQGALAVLMVPLDASQVVDEWHWNPGAYVFAYVLFFGRAALRGRKIAILHGVFGALFTASGLLFRHASLTGLE
jgi:hypothetical protein